MKVVMMKILVLLKELKNNNKIITIMKKYILQEQLENQKEKLFLRMKNKIKKFLYKSQLLLIKK